MVALRGRAQLGSTSPALPERQGRTREPRGRATRQLQRLRKNDLSVVRHCEQLALHIVRLRLSVAPARMRRDSRLDQHR